MSDKTLVSNDGTEISVGTKVTWSSQAGGTRRQKTGVVAAIVEVGENPFKMRGVGELLENTPKSRIKFDGGERKLVRALVEVPRGGKSLLSDFYCPYASLLRIVEGGDLT